jgi:hypothetical protein
MSEKRIPFMTEDEVDYFYDEYNRLKEKGNKILEEYNKLDEINGNTIDEYNEGYQALGNGERKKVDKALKNKTCPVDPKHFELVQIMKRQEEESATTQNKHNELMNIEGRIRDVVKVYKSKLVVEHSSISDLKAEGYDNIERFIIPETTIQELSISTYKRIERDVSLNNIILEKIIGIANSKSLIIAFGEDYQQPKTISEIEGLKIYAGTPIRYATKD